ncbi:unnamed protein product [marine sediment metagenome]|uniref:Uncharacterized protein n=1 Tax=marine sediment metagenome TaxID=412755 RepID=X0SZ01_9ZZZZ
MKYLIGVLCFLFVCAYAYLALAQDIPPGAGEEITFGKYSLPLIIWILMSIVYRVWDKFPSRAKVPTAVALGVILGVLFVGYSGMEYTIKNVVDHVLFGLMAGFTSAGLYEGVNRAALRPRN